ncbi:anaerobic ribonucleoside-triphosphate reductase activating protein [Coprobacter sp.]
MIDYIYILDIVEDTTVDGPGLRTSVYSAGCPHRCPGCHNPQSWDIYNGKKVSLNEILSVIKNNDFDDVTFSGGDPFFQSEAFTELARRIKEETSKNIWCYTGYSYEEIVSSSRLSVLLPYIDVLVDGKFIETYKDAALLFRGSSNQRLIDVPVSLKQGKAVEFVYNPFSVLK